MTGGAPPETTGAVPPRSNLWGRRARAALDAHPVAAAIGLYAIVAIAAAIAAYLAIFTQFAVYDDEGTLLVTIKAFVHGDVLYRDIYSPYGPFYYELFGGLFSLTGWPVSTDVSRLIVVMVWVASSVLLGVSVQRLTGRLMMGVTGMLVAFAVLIVLISEPMHPHGLCVLLLCGVTLLVVSGPPRRVALTGAGAGALLGALVLTKVNLGSLAIAALALAAVLSVEPLHRRRWLRWPVIGVFLALPTALMARELGADWIRELIALEFFGTLALLIAARPASPRRGDADEGLSRWLLGAVGGLLLTVVVVMGIALITGPSLSDLFDGTIYQGLRLGDLFVAPFISPPAAADWGIVAVAASMLTVGLRSGGAGEPSIWPGLLRAAAGLVIWITVARSAPFSLNPASNTIALPVALTWVAVLAPSDVREPQYRRFLRVFLPALALAETLQVYPVAGSQVGISSITFVAVGALCIADGLRLLRAWSAERGIVALERFTVVTAVAIVGLAGKLAFDVILRPAATHAVAYRHQQALPFADAGLEHPPTAQGDEYRRLVELLRAHRCTTFIGYPNLNSLYLWSGIDPPKPSAPGTWVSILEREPQQRVVDQMRASPRPCAIRNDTLAAGWLQGAPTPDTPLVRYIFNAFRPVETVGEWQFLLPLSSDR